MRRTLPRLVALVLVIVSFLVLATARASAQEQVAASVVNAATVLPASLTSAVLFPAAATAANATQSGAPIPTIGQVERYSSPKRPIALPLLYASTIALQALDAHSTMQAINLGAQEANPFMKGAAGNPGALIAVKAGMAGATIFFAEKMWRRNPVAAVAMMAVINGVSLAVVSHNYRVAKSLR
jgi:hypothetical protein